MMSPSNNPELEGQKNALEAKYGVEIEKIRQLEFQHPETIDRKTIYRILVGHDESAPVEFHQTFAGSKDGTYMAGKILIKLEEHGSDDFDNVEKAYGLAILGERIFQSEIDSFSSQTESEDSENDSTPIGIAQIKIEICENVIAEVSNFLTKAKKDGLKNIVDDIINEFRKDQKKFRKL